MKISILVLGAIATSASAASVPLQPNREVSQASSTSHHHSPAPYPTANSPAQAKPYHGHSHSTPISLASLSNSIRTWLSQHNLIHHPSSTQHPPPTSAPEPIVRINWNDPVFADEDPSSPLTPLELFTKISEMVRDPSAAGGYLPLLKSGNIKVETRSRGLTHTRVYFPGFGRQGGDDVSPHSGEKYVVADMGDDEEAIRRKIDMAIQAAKEEVEWRGIRTAINVNGEMVRLSQPEELSMEEIEETRASLGDRHDDGVRAYNFKGEARVVGPAHNFRGSSAVTQGRGTQRPGGGLDGKAGWHHRQAPTFIGRLHRAMRKLRPAECLALAFVMGAGLGSILHMFFMAVLLSIRTIRYGRLSKEERRARRAGKRAKRNGRGIIRLEGEDALGVSVERGSEVVGDVEALPGYQADAALARKLAHDKA